MDILFKDAINPRNDAKSEVIKYIITSENKILDKLLEKRLYASLSSYQNAPASPAEFVKYTYNDYGQTDGVIQDKDGNAATTTDQHYATRTQSFSKKFQAEFRSLIMWRNHFRERILQHNPTPYCI